MNQCAAIAIGSDAGFGTGAFMPPAERKMLTARHAPIGDAAMWKDTTPTRRRHRGRPRRDEADAARRSILEAALRQFVACGYAAASMAGIARDAGVAKLTLYRHFETKEALFSEVAVRAQRSVRERLGPMVHGGQSLEAVLRDVVERLYDAYTHPEYLAVTRMVTSESLRFPGLGRAMLDDSEHVVGPLVEYLQQLKDGGLVDIDSPRDAATHLAGLAGGAGRYVLLPPSQDPAQRRRAIESLVDLFVRAWRGPG